MFSQLCAVNPRTLWDKIATIAQRSVDLNEEEPHCQLEHCTFCDYRGEGESFHKEVQHIQSSDTCFEATENPAYGLSAKHWLEIKDEEENEVDPPAFLNETMESPSTDASQDSNTGLLSPNLQTSLKKGTSQQESDCDGVTMNPSQSYGGNQTNMETRHKRIDPLIERPKSDFHKSNDQKHHGGLTWSVLKHRQIDALENCDKTNPCVIEHSNSDKPIFNTNLDGSKEQAEITKAKRGVKDRTFPLSLMKPIAKIADKKSEQQMGQKADISRQRPVQRGKFTPVTNQSRRMSTDILGVNSNPLSAMEQIKTEESIQEWLARIGESTNSIDGDENRSAWEPNRKETTKSKLRTEAANVLNKGLQEALEISHGKSFPSQKQSPDNSEYNERLLPEEENVDTAGLLCNASKASPANIPMVVMQCSRLHSHIGSKPPFQQTSLPMGTLVTALYQESDWLYVQTPHGVEGFIIASNCVPIGTTNDPAHNSRRPWEPCDFPIEINVRRQCEFSRQHGAYIPAKLPTNGNKHTSPYVSTVKMKTNFYSDRYFTHTFKSKDSIKTAKTVTDILRNSPETKVSNQ